MADTLLKTKLFIPPTRNLLVSRARLIKQLDDGLNYKLTLISAPAGFGKTTLVSSWIHQLQPAPADTKRIKVCWFSLDDRDNDPITFWQYIGAAFLPISPAIGAAVKTMLDTLPAFSVEVVVTMFLNEIVEHNQHNLQSQPIILILDDYHLISNQDIHASLNFLLDHLPHFMHLVITTRADPPLNLSYRQGRSEIYQIRAADLSFSTEESVEFLNTIMGLELSQKDIHTLEDRTEGWIAGLQLAAISLQEQSDKQSFVSVFAGDDRYVADYLVDQVLQHQPPHIKDFLLKTSILNQLSAPICSVLTQQKDSQDILNHLENENLFLSPLDNRREWFRYHSLFIDLLRKNLQKLYTEEQISNLHLIASEWYEKRQEIIEAINHAMLSGAHSRAAQLIEVNSDEIFKQFKLNSLVQWIQVLPHPIQESRPALNMIYAWALLALGRFKETENRLQLIEKKLGLRTSAVNSKFIETLGVNERGALLEILTVRSVLAINRFDIPATLQLCQTIEPWLIHNEQPHLFNPALSLRTVVLFNLGLAYEFSGDGLAAETAFQEAASLSIEQKNIHILQLSISHLGQLQVLQGQLRQAKNTYQQALKSSSQITGKHSPIAGIAEIGLGYLYYEWNDLERSCTHFKTGIELGKQWNHSEILLMGYLGLCLLEKAKGNFAGSFTWLSELEIILRDNQASMLLPSFHTFRARLWIYQENFSEANHWLQSTDLRLDGTLDYLNENNYITYARLLIAEQKWVEAEKLISRLLEFADLGKRQTRLIELLILQSLLKQGQGNSNLAEETLARALKMAEPERYIRSFLDEGPALAAILYKLVGSNATISPYAGEILRAFGMQAMKTQDKEVASNELIEPLSDREMEVLQCLVEGLSNREIANKLTVSLSTVKTHTRNIYAKLEANSRTQAIAQAKKWGLIS